jgi:nucleoside-triphosphatase THEP1
MTSAPITAILYSDGREVDPAMARIASLLGEAGVSLAGFVQRNEPREDRRRCDMVLEELASGMSIGISQDRGPMARGCHLDLGELLRGMELARAALGSNPDLMIINKFGKSEGEGGGFRPLMAEAVMAGVPLLVAVPWRNIDGWRLFAGDLATEIPVERIASAPDMLDALGFQLRGDAPDDAPVTPRPAGCAH